MFGTYDNRNKSYQIPGNILLLPYDYDKNDCCCCYFGTRTAASSGGDTLLAAHVRYVKEARVPYLVRARTTS